MAVTDKTGAVYESVGTGQVPLATAISDIELALNTGAYGGLGNQYNDVSSTSLAVLTTTQTAGAQNVYIDMTGTLTAGSTVTLPSTSTWLTAIATWQGLALPSVGSSYHMRIGNSGAGAFAWTLTAGDASTTVTAPAAIGNLTWHDYIVTVLSATTIGVNPVGGGVWP